MGASTVFIILGVGLAVLLGLALLCGVISELWSY